MSQRDKAENAVDDAQSAALELPKGMFIAIDADCPGCGWGERRWDPNTEMFSCAKCSYSSRHRNA